MRENINFDSSWQFVEQDLEVQQSRFKGYMYTHAKTERAITGPAAPAQFSTDWSRNGDWEAVTLPHDYVIKHEPEQKYNNTLGYFPYNNAWYRKKFTLAEEDRGRRITLYFEGVAVHATIWVNGCLMYHSFCGYVPFEVDITDVARYGADNFVAVYVEADDHEGWWYEGAGIYRHVWLTKTPIVSLDRYGIFVTARREEDCWFADVTAEIRNDSFEDAEFDCKITILDAKGRAVGSRTGRGKVERKSDTVMTRSVRVKSPRLWDTENPNMYTAQVEVIANPGTDGETVDINTARFGFREAVFDADRGFLLNGKPVKIKGVCCHGDFGLTGKAVPDNILRYRVRLLREMGANGYRCAHYPHAEATMDALDDNGFLVMAETRWFESSKEGREQLAALIRRDRNHPSVVMWSLGNEEPYFAKEQGKRIFETLYADVKCLDPTRPIMGSISNSPDKAPINEVSDIIGINYNLQAYDTLRERFSDKCFVSSENCAVGTSRGYYTDGDCNEPIDGRIKSYDFTMSGWQTNREETWKFIAARDWVAGGYQWAGIEHRGETQWPRLCSVSGALDLFLQKKDAFYQNKSHWTEEPMVHLIPHWNFEGREGDEILVRAYTNCPKVELFLNEKSLGAVEVEKYGHADWNVAYEPGTLKAVATAADGSVVTAVRATTGAPVSLKLELLNGDDFKANGCDLALVNCYALDAEGRKVPDASPYVTFSASRPARLVATGSDNTDHVPPFCAERRMYAGIIAAAVRFTAKGTAKLYASAPGLKSAVLEIEGK